MVAVDNFGLPGSQGLELWLKPYQQPSFVCDKDVADQSLRATSVSVKS